MKHLLLKIFSFILLQVLLQSFSYASTDVLIKERVQFGKPLRVKMPPQIMIDTIQDQFQIMSPKWSTFWQNFVVEDDEAKDEFVIIARTVEKPWAFRLTKEDCPKPDNYEKLLKDIDSGGTPVRMDILIGVKRKRSWFRYVVNMYEPIYDYWTNPCYTWDLPPGTATKEFYKKNYTMKVYADNLREDIYTLLTEIGKWKPPKKVKKIPAMRGSGGELIGGEAEELTDDERKLPASEQQKIIDKKKKEKKK